MVLDTRPGRSAGRHTLVDRMRNADTIQLVTSEGIGPGARCLDLGTGSADLLQRLAELVGPTGTVDAFVPAVLADPGDATQRPPAITVRTDDLAHADLGDGIYDLVHARDVLSRIAERNSVVARAARALRPGGLMVICEADYRHPEDLATATRSSEAVAAITACQRAYVEHLVANGTSVRWAPQLGTVMGGVGLAHINVVSYADEAAGNEPPCLQHHTNIETHFQALLTRGLAATTIQRQAAALRDPRTRVREWPRITATGIRPATRTGPGDDRDARGSAPAPSTPPTGSATPPTVDAPTAPGPHARDARPLGDVR